MTEKYMNKPALNISSEMERGFRLGALWVNLNSLGGIQSAILDANDEHVARDLATQSGYEVFSAADHGDGRIAMLFRVAP